MNIATLEVVAERVTELLNKLGPLHEDELLDELAADDVDCPADLFDKLYSYEGLLPLVRLLDDGRYCAADMILSGRTFTHRLTEAEIAGDCLELDADLHGPLSLDEDDRYQEPIVGVARSGRVGGQSGRRAHRRASHGGRFRAGVHRGSGTQ